MEKCLINIEIVFWKGYSFSLLIGFIYINIILCLCKKLACSLAVAL